MVQDILTQIPGLMHDGAGLPWYSFVVELVLYFTTIVTVIGGVVLFAVKQPKKVG